MAENNSQQAPLIPSGEQERQQLRAIRDQVFDSYRLILKDQQEHRKLHPRDLGKFYSDLLILLERLKPKMDERQPVTRPACYVIMKYFQEQPPRDLEIARLALREVSQFLEVIHVSDLPKENVVQG